MNDYLAVLQLCSVAIQAGSKLATELSSNVPPASSQSSLDPARQQSTATSFPVTRTTLEFSAIYVSHRRKGWPALTRPRRGRPEHALRVHKVKCIIHLNGNYREILVL